MLMKNKNIPLVQTAKITFLTLLPAARSDFIANTCGKLHDINAQFMTSSKSDYEVNSACAWHNLM